MTLKARVTEDMKSAMRAKDAPRLAALRLLLAAIKQRRDSMAQFEAGGRPDLARGEAFELALLQSYLPAQLSEAEIEEAIAAAIGETGASGPQGMGKVMALLKAKLAGQADMSQVSARVKSRLAG